MLVYALVVALGTLLGRIRVAGIFTFKAFYH